MYIFLRQGVGRILKSFVICSNEQFTNIVHNLVAYRPLEHYNNLNK